MESELAELDVGLFAHIESQTSDEDKRSLLALQRAVRGRGAYVYLEIGSHLGGSLQPLLVDDRCSKIISIDPRPTTQPDARLPDGTLYHYEGNSTERMYEQLQTVPGADLSKLTTIEKSTEDIAADSVTDPPDLCFIDGQHTDQAAIRDAIFCLNVAAPDALIVFHDAHAVPNAIGAVLRTSGGYGYQMSDCLFVIERSGPRVFDLVRDRVRHPGIWSCANRAGVAGAAAATLPGLVTRLLGRNTLSTRTS
jgi:hypothetical protein